jgi:FlaA1/EpsC-like NDP-sugar epimerase
MLKVFEHHVPMSTLVALLADGAFCFLAVLVASTQLQGGPFATQGTSVSMATAMVLAAAFTGVMSLLYSFVGIYRSGSATVSLGGMLGRAFFALFMGSCIAYLALELQGDSAYALRLAGRAVPIMAAGVIAVRIMVYLAQRTSIGARRVLIVGTGDEAHAVAADLAASGPSSRHTVVGFYPTTPDAESPAPGALTVFSSNLSIGEVVRRQKVDEVIVAVREQRGGAVPMDQLLACRIAGVPVLDLAGFFERARGEVPIDSLKASWLVYGHGFVQGSLRRLVTRLFDVVSSAVLLILALPVMLITAIAIKLESPGPVIYRQERVGLGGRSFMCLKFRSMRNAGRRRTTPA